MQPIVVNFMLRPSLQTVAFMAVETSLGAVCELKTLAGHSQHTRFRRSPVKGTIIPATDLPGTLVFAGVALDNLLGYPYPRLLGYSSNYNDPANHSCETLLLDTHVAYSSGTLLKGTTLNKEKMVRTLERNKTLVRNTLASPHVVRQSCSTLFRDTLGGVLLKETLAETQHTLGDTVVGGPGLLSDLAGQDMQSCMNTSTLPGNTEIQTQENVSLMQ